MRGCAFGLALLFTGVLGSAVAENVAAPDDLTEWRYELVRSWDGSEMVARIALATEDAAAMDAAARQEVLSLIEEGALAGYDGVTEPAAWAEWVVYARQVTLWGRYAEQCGYTSGNPSATIQWPGGEDSTTADPAPLHNKLEAEVIQAYGDAVAELRDTEAAQAAVVASFEARALGRENQRMARADWQDSRVGALSARLNEWDRVHRGEIVLVNGTRYELLSSDGMSRSGDAVGVFSDRLTPYDLLDTATGELLKPSGV